MRYFWIVPLLGVFLAGCSAPNQAKQAPAVPTEPGPAATSGKHPYAKFIELNGFRLSEAGPGKAAVKFIAVNHSEADLPEITAKVRMVTSVRKPEDPPVLEFEAKIPALGPQEIKDIAIVVNSKLRAYELPDWQFLRAEFDITAPEP